MKRSLQMVAAVIVISAITVWFVGGAHTGWTRTTAPKKTVDEITGLEAITYEKRFVMGVDLLGVSLLTGIVLAGASMLFRPKSNQHEQSN